MPIYEFECQACHKIAEKIMSSSDPLPTECEACGQGPMKKLLSQSAFILKGGGWYSEGYTSTNSAKPNSTPSEKKSESKSSESSSSSSSATTTTS